MPAGEERIDWCYPTQSADKRPLVPAGVVASSISGICTAREFQLQSLGRIAIPRTVPDM